MVMHAQIQKNFPGEGGPRLISNLSNMNFPGGAVWL